MPLCTSATSARPAINISRFSTEPAVGTTSTLGPSSAVVVRAISAAASSYEPGRGPPANVMRVGGGDSDHAMVR
jgi:hypothetical protein